MPSPTTHTTTVLQNVWWQQHAANSPNAPCTHLGFPIFSAQKMDEQREGDNFSPPLLWRAYSSPLVLSSRE